MAAQPIFITGIGTGIGKTIVSAIITEALQADFWKPVQAGFKDGTDTVEIKELISNNLSVIHPEAYKLSLPASPHIAARKDNIHIDLNGIKEKYHQLSTNSHQLIIEGAGGLMVPLNENEFVIDLIQKLSARVILVSRNYLGSINHSLLTAAVCKQRNIDVIGWVFNGAYMNYEDEIVQWTSIPKIAAVPFVEYVTSDFILAEAKKIKVQLLTLL